MIHVCVLLWSIVHCWWTAHSLWCRVWIMAQCVALWACSNDHIQDFKVVFLYNYPDCSSCLVHLNSIGWAVCAILAALKKCSLNLFRFDSLNLNHVIYTWTPWEELWACQPIPFSRQRIGQTDLGFESHCWSCVLANFSFHAVTSYVMGSWWNKKHVWLTHDTCICVQSVDYILLREMRLFKHMFLYNGR